MKPIVEVTAAELETAFGEATAEAAAKAERLTAALIALTACNIPVDVQELLLRGDPMRGIANGALHRAIEAARAYGTPRS